MLAEGQTIYRGTTMGLIPFLSSMGLECPSYHNPADFVMEVATGEHGTFTEKLVTAVANGKCNNLSEGSPSANKKSATGPISLNNDIIKKQSEQICQDEVKIYMTHLDHINNLGSPDSIPMTPNKTRTEPDGESNPEEAKPEDYCKSSLLDNGSMESIDEHCKNFATSSWTQFKVKILSGIRIDFLFQVLFIRTFFSIMRDQTLTYLRAFSHVACALLIGALYWDIGNY